DLHDLDQQGVARLGTVDGDGTGEGMTAQLRAGTGGALDAARCFEDGGQLGVEVPGEAGDGVAGGTPLRGLPGGEGAGVAGSEGETREQGGVPAGMDGIVAEVVGGRVGHGGLRGGAEGSGAMPPILPYGWKRASPCPPGQAPERPA